MRVAVVGGGIYGCTTAVELARNGHTVELYERHHGLLHGASRANQGRLHSGYHYPRSLPTALAARADAASFAARFPTAIDHTAGHYYAIAGKNSRTSAADYLAFCDLLGGDHRVVDPPDRLLQGVDVCVAVDEAFINLPKLREILRKELRVAGVTVHLATTADPDTLPHDLVVMATYGQPFPIPLRYEVCETVLLNLGSHYARRSFVIMDGAFVCLDPLPQHGRDGDIHALYDVEHSVHHVSVGTVEIPDHLAPLIDRGPVLTAHSREPRMAGSLRRFLRRVGMPSYRGSLFTVRAVLPDVDATDARPTIVHVDGDRVWLLAGKIDGAVAAAGRVVALAAERSGVAVPETVPA